MSEKTVLKKVSGRRRETVTWDWKNVLICIPHQTLFVSCNEEEKRLVWHVALMGRAEMHAKVLVRKPAVKENYLEYLAKVGG